MADNKLMSYLAGHGMQPGALDRLSQKMEQTRGTKPLFTANKPGQMQGGQKPMPSMYRGR